MQTCMREFVLYRYIHCCAESETSRGPKPKSRKGLGRVEYEDET